MANWQEIEKSLNKNSENNKNWGEEVNRKGAAYVDHEKFERIRKEIEKKIKDQILEDLSVWELGWEGELVVVPGAPISLVDGGSIKFSIDYQKEIIRAFIEEIKQNPQDWKIEIEEEGLDYQIVKHKSGRKHYRGYQFYNNLRPGFSDEEWKEIENVLNNQEKKSVVPSRNPNPKNHLRKLYIWGVVAVSILILLAISLIAVKKQKNNSPKKI